MKNRIFQIVHMKKYRSNFAHKIIYGLCMYVCMHCYGEIQKRGIRMVAILQVRNLTLNLCLFLLFKEKNGHLYKLLMSQTAVFLSAKVKVRLS